MFYRKKLSAGLILSIAYLQSQDLVLMGRVLYQEIEKPSFLTITLGDGTKPIQSTTLDQNWMYRFQKLYQGNYELHVIKNGE
ncbi:MAG: hypothetical protein ACO219_03795, partial [Holophagaceae bacterium]